jgi:hypothetical protein
MPLVLRPNEDLPSIPFPLVYTYYAIDADGYALTQLFSASPAVAILG